MRKYVPLILVAFAALASYQAANAADMAKPPKGAVVLFDGDKTNLFLSKNGKATNWAIEDDAIISGRGQGRSNHIVSSYHFRDAKIHVEFMLSEKGSSNSGIYIHGNYELQIIHSAGKEKLGAGDCGGIYGFHKPLVNAALGRDVWQVYDITYIAPRRDKDGKITKPGNITATLNGKLVQDGAEFFEPRSTYHPYRYNTTDYLKTIWKKQLATSIGPVFLQDHDNPVRFRNVWVKPLDDKAGMYEPPKKD